MPFALNKIAVPDPLRARIYEAALAAAAADFEALARQAGARYATALRDRDLLNALAALLDEYVLCGVGADLGRCRADLYGPAPRPAPPQTVASTDSYLSSARPINPPTADDRKRSASDLRSAYRRYFDWFISPRVIQGGVEMSGIDAFRQRYPMVAHAIDTVAGHFRTNVAVAITRIRADWDLISSFFFAANPPRQLFKITSSGSDFHKGGKQVLIMTFKAADNSLRKLVYKPSDLELDYRLVGDTQAVRSDPSLSGQLGAQRSFAEELNACTNDAYPIPTYRILPRNPGSGLVVNAGALPVETSYGYVEFLTNQPPPRADGTPHGWNPGQAADWVASTPADVERFFRQAGRILAMALTLSMSDLHVDNLIVHALQPYTIDTEISFTGPVDSVNSTFLLGSNVAGLLADQSPTARRGREQDGTANLYVQDVSADVTHSPGHNRVYLATDGKPPVRATPGEYAAHLTRGFLEMMTAVRRAQAQLSAWLQDPQLQNVVARFTPEATATFNGQLRLTYGPMFCSQPVPTQPTDFNRAPFSLWVQSATNDWSALRPAGRWPAPRPNYVLHTPNNDFADYLSCDIPAYYHRLVSTDLLNARGQPVVVQPPPAAPQIGRAGYFPQSTLSIVQQQVTSLQSDDAFQLRVDNAVAELLKQFSSNATAVRQVWSKFVAVRV